MAQMTAIEYVIAACKVIAPIAYAIIEYKLGKTDFGSTLGLLLTAVKKKPQKEMYDMNNELKLVLIALMDFGKLGQMVIKDKGIAAEEEGPLLQLFMDFSPAMNNFGKGIEQLKSLDGAGEADLVAFMASKLGIADPKAADIFIKGVNFLFAGFQLKQAISK